MSKKSPETILREALVVARDELLRVTHEGWVVRPDVFPQINSALVDVPAIPAIPHVSEIEKRIAGKIVTDLLAAGYQITVNDGEEDTVVRSTDPDRIFEAMGSTDADVLKVTGNPAPHRKRSFVAFVWGNGRDCIHDYGMNIADLIEPACEYADKLDGLEG
jgi:hypothetical protein